MSGYVFAGISAGLVLIGVVSGIWFPTIFRWLQVGMVGFVGFAGLVAGIMGIYRLKKPLPSNDLPRWHTMLGIGIGVWAFLLCSVGCYAIITGILK